MAREIVVRMWRISTPIGPKPPYPNVPDFADFRDGIKPFIQTEILRAQLEVVQRHGAYVEAMRIQKELDALQLEIHKWEGPT